MSRGCELFAAAARRAAALLEDGFSPDKRPEERLRQCLIKAVFESGMVVATAPDAGGTTEHRPTLTEWPNLPNSRLGGVDLAVRVEGDAVDNWRYFAELKWDALWMQLWDAYKLCHVSRLPGVEETFLVAIATQGEWDRQVDGSDLFREEAATSTTYLLRERYPTRWQKLLDESSKSRPSSLPTVLATSRVADVPLETKYGRSRLRVAAVRPQSDWLAVDAEGWPIAPQPVVWEWPHPEPGPGMDADERFVWPSRTPPLIADEALSADDVPSELAGWSEIMWFAASVDGYSTFGASENLAPLANTVTAYWQKTRDLPDLGLRELRACLFFEYRRHHHYGHAPDARTTPYIRALIERIRELAARPRQ